LKLRDIEMKKLFIIKLCVMTLFFYSFAYSKERIDQVPMYGGMDRSQFETLKQADEQLIRDTTKQFGSREKSSMAFVGTAFNYYQQGDNQRAMARFNQAWLMNPDNPEVYWGFSAILHDAGKFCEGFRLLELGVSKGPMQSAYKPDLAVLYANCAIQNSQISEEEKEQYLAKSEQIFIDAENDQSVPKPYLYFQWARTLNSRGQYPQAWEVVKKYRAISNRPFDKKLLEKISTNMPEPE
jgi:Tfp pilus assembly protein PilF